MGEGAYLGGTTLTTRSQAVRWVLVAWIVAFPVIVAFTYFTSRADYAVMSVTFVGGLLLIPWLIGVLVIALLARRWRTTG